MSERPGSGPTLDGLAFLNPDERAAVRWLSEQQAQAGDRVVVAEAAADEYSVVPRPLSTYAGTAAVLGWAGHELQWRGPVPELGRREADLRSLYREAPPEGIRSLLDRYGVRFVVVGDLERQKYGDEVTSRFDGILAPGARFGSITIYRAR
jgi:uncharacterized membrane protein